MYITYAPYRHTPAIIIDRPACEDGDMIWMVIKRILFGIQIKFVFELTNDRGQPVKYKNKGISYHFSVAMGNKLQ